MYEVVVIGGGPAGLAATMYCIRKGMDVQLITTTLGGKSTLSFNLPDMSEYHIVKAREQVQTFQGRIEYLDHTWRKAKVTAVKEIEGGFAVTVSEPGAPPTRLETEYLVVATGTTPTPMGIPGERDFFGKGLGSSAISYSHLLRDRHAVVIGDSDRAIEAAMECAEQCSAVSLVLEPHAEYSHHHLEMVARREVVAVYNGYRPVRVEGDTFARSITICRGDAHKEECAPQKTIGADAFFVERDPRPNSVLVADVVDCTPRGAIRINERNETSHPRIFAAGDVTTVGIEQILVALGEGARAGLSAYHRHIEQS